MKIARFEFNDEIRYGIIEGQEIFPLKIKYFEELIAGGKRNSASLMVSKVRLLPPAEPTKIVLAGLNYTDHAAELGMKLPDEPVIFLKPSSSVIGHGENIVYPRDVTRMDYEAELAVVIGRRCRNIQPGSAAGYILGYTCLNDVTARDIQNKDGQWTRAKSFDSFCPLGPYIETDFNPSDVSIKARLNGKIKQSSRTSNLIFNVPFLVSFISKVMTLLPGNIISTGTPPGIGPMEPGDRIEVEIEGLESLKNNVILEKG